MTARQNIGKALGEFLAVVLEEIAASLDRHTSRMDAVRPIAPAAATEEPGRVEFNPAAPPPAPVPDDRSCPVEVRGVPCVLPMAHTGAHVDPLGAFLAPFVTVPESDGLEAERMAERGLTDDQADATPVPFVDLGETAAKACEALSANGDRSCDLPEAHEGAHGDHSLPGGPVYWAATVETCGAGSSTGLVCDQPKGHDLAHSAAGTVVGWWDPNDPEWPMPDDADQPTLAEAISTVVLSRRGERMPAVERALDACHAADERDAARAALAADAAQHPATDRLRVADQLERTEAAQAVHDRLTSLLPPVDPAEVLPQMAEVFGVPVDRLPAPSEVGHGRPLVLDVNGGVRPAFPDPENVELVQAHDSTGLECPVCFRRRHTADQAAECAGIAEAIERGLT